MNKRLYSIAIFGGTFDPVHLGHVNVATNLQTQCQFDKFDFLPCKIPLLKKPNLASSHHRVEMLKLALKNHPEFSISLEEIKRDSPSYMVETLSKYRTSYPSASLTLILGQDAFHKLPSWQQWKRIMTLANIIIINRSNFNDEFPRELQNFLQDHETNKLNKLFMEPKGNIYKCDAGDYEISSTDVRKRLIDAKDASELINKDVYKYINKNHLY